MRTNLIAVSGKIGSGKDTFTQIFQSIAFQKSTLLWENRKFGYKVKEFASMLTGIPTEDFEKREVKAMSLPSCWDTDYLDSKQIKEDLGGSSETIPMTGRELLIRIGHGCRVQIHEDVWVNGLFSERGRGRHVEGEVKENSIINISLITPQKLPNWIISDLRYPNECRRIKQEGGILVRINSEREQKIEHPSETLLDNYTEFDYVIDNSGTIEELKQRVDQIGKELGIWNY